MVTYSLQGDFAKATLFHHVCFFCVQKDSHLYWRKQNWRIKLVESRFAKMPQKLPTYYLQMIPCYFAKPLN